MHGHDSRPPLPSVERTTVELAPYGTAAGVFSAYGWRNVAITLWFGPATVESVKAFEDICQRCVDAFPAGGASVHIMIPGGKSLPSAEARSELARVFSKYAAYSATTAVVIPGTGFWAGALRSLVTAFSLVAQLANKPQVFADIHAVSEWLPASHTERTGIAVTSRELLAALRVAVTLAQQQTSDDTSLSNAVISDRQRALSLLLVDSRKG